MGSRNSKLVVMTVAGLDPSAGAGILADIKTIAAFGCYGVGVTTALTFQNTLGVFGVRPEPAESVRRQMELLLSDFNVVAIKTGMLASADSVEVVADQIERFGIRNVVVDPVIVSSSGHDLAGDSVDATIRRLFPLAAVVTPNVAEAARLTGIAVTGRGSMELAGRRIMEMGPRAVVVKGGDLEDNESAIDLLIDPSGISAFETVKLVSNNTHGTGCAFSSALACLLAQGLNVTDAVSKAKEYVFRAIQSAPGLGRGKGPLNHFASKTP